MDVRIRQIVPKAPGTYFIVTDNSQIQEIEEESRLRIFFINSELGPVNCLVKFAKNDVQSFRETFGRASRSKQKKGDFGHKVCEDALSGGPIGVVNLRAFDDIRDVAQVASINPNTKLVTAVRDELVPYTMLFNRNGFWIANKENITQNWYETTGYLNFANISTQDVSIFVVKASDADVANLTAEGEETLDSTQLEVTDYEGLNWSTKVKDTFVKVYIFKNTFENAHTNSLYGSLFNQDDTIPAENLDALTNISAAGFVNSYVGSLIPDLKNENADDIAIDVVMYQDYMITGVMADINQDLLENPIESGSGMIDTFGYDSMLDGTGAFVKVPAFMSYPEYTYSYDHEDPIPYIPTSSTENMSITTKSALKYAVKSFGSNTFVTNVNTGLKIDDYIIGEDRLLQITNIEVGENETFTNYEEVYSDEILQEKGNVLYANNRYYAINDKQWLTSTDGKKWMNVDLDFTTTPSGKTLTYENIVNNAVAVGSKIVAIAYCAEENANYIVTLESSTVSMQKIDGTGSKYHSLTYNSGVYLIYGTRTLVSTNGTDWNMVYVSGTSTEGLIFAQPVEGVTGVRFIGLYSPNDFSQDFSDEFTDSNYQILYSADGRTWLNIASDYSGVSYSDVRATANGWLMDDTNIYIFGNNKLYSIAKTDINDSTKTWTATTITSTYTYSSAEIYPVVISQTSTETKVLLNSAEDEINAILTINKSNFSAAFSAGPQVNAQDFYAVRTVVANDRAFYLHTKGTEDYNTYVFYYTSASEETFKMVYEITYSLATYTVDGTITTFGESGSEYIVKANPFTKRKDVALNNFVLKSYKPSESQFINGSPTRQDEILQMMLSKGIVKGLKSSTGIRYLVDCFKSYVEPNYKWQFGNLCNTLHEGNKFVTALVNEPFVTDLMKSTNPLFKDTPSDPMINYEYLPIGGNKQYSRTLLTKPTDENGAGWCFFFGPEDIINGIPCPIIGLISNLFVNKTYQFDIVANETGYISGINQLGENFDDDERKYLNKFRYNPIVKFDSGYTIYGNQSGQRVISKQQQIHNVELLCYIKEQLFNMARPDTFKKGTYDEYLSTQVRTEEFMNSLVMANAVKPDGLVVKCDLENNTTEIQNYRIKLVHVEYVPYDCIEKVVFDININK